MRKQTLLLVERTAPTLVANNKPITRQVPLRNPYRGPRPYPASRALQVGCKKCPIFAICPVKGIIGDYRKPTTAQDRTKPAK